MLVSNDLTTLYISTKECHYLAKGAHIWDSGCTHKSPRVSNIENQVYPLRYRVYTKDCVCSKEFNLPQIYFRLLQ